MKLSAAIYIYIGSTDLKITLQNVEILPQKQEKSERVRNNHLLLTRLLATLTTSNSPNATMTCHNGAAVTTATMTCTNQ